MLRTFETHKIRKTEELSGKLWDFNTISDEGEGENRKVMVPSCLEKYPGLENYRGWCKYQTTFEGVGNLLVTFKGVSHFAKVLVDGKEVAQHYGSYTPFDALIKKAQGQKHTLEVLVDNDFREEYSLDIPNDYMSYGGISRGVEVAQVPDCYVKNIHVTPLREENGDWIVDAQVYCENVSEEPLSSTLSLVIAGTKTMGVKKTMKRGETIWIFNELRVQQVETWELENPALYPVQAILRQENGEEDDLIERVGFRTISVKGKQILINGHPIRIKGFCRHEDHPQYGCALPPEAIAYDLGLAIDMGANSIRTSHYPNDEVFLDLCDELGILVWEENHARGLETDQMKNPYFEKQCEQVIREMITAHYNHPSIYIWGILNECGSESEYGRSCYKAQYDLIRELDNSRPCTSASCRFNIDICQDLPDVCSWNMYPYWYDERSATQMASDVIQWVDTKGNGAGKPFIISEIGAGAIYGFRDSANDIWSENLQAEIIEKQLSELFALENCEGCYIWQFCDVRVCQKDWALRRPKSRNNKGIVDEYRRPKMAYNVVKSIYTSLSNYWDQ